MFSRFKRQSRKPTTTAFVSDNPFAVERSAPPPVPKNDPVTVTENTVDKGKQTDRETKDNEVEADQGRAADDKRQAITGGERKDTYIVKSNQRQIYDEGESSRAGKAYFGFWNLEVDYHLEDIHHDIVNEYTVNCMAMFVILQACDVFVSGNNWVQRYAPEYLHYGTLCYYSILFYYQILRARRAAGKIIEGTEGKFLRRFEKKFKPEMLIVCGPLVPFFSSIIAHDMGDGKYDWIVPRIAIEMMTGQLLDFTARDGAVYLQPTIPYMLGFLRTMISNQFYTAATTDEDTYTDGNGDIIPGNIADVTIFGMRIQQGQANDADDIDLLSSTGFSSPTMCTIEQLGKARMNWNRSSFAELNVGMLNLGARNRGTDGMITNVDGTQSIAGIANFLCMPNESNMNFMYKLIENANTHANMFKHKTNMSKIPNVGGRDMLVLGTFKRHEATAAAANHYADIHLGRTDANVNWYPQLFNNMTCSFSTDRADAHRVDELQAFAFAVNSELPIIQANGPPQVLVGNTAIQRTGPYFRERERPVSTHRADDNVGKPMFSGWRAMIKAQFALDKPASD
uniref:Coat protein n=1 Tax=Rhizoctonia solani partitivirus 7 TaxID=2600110 RepID=A0A5B8HA12_9VIRU|nr:coat protein [Rhizoctonia solani partitivirus 7]